MNSSALHLAILALVSSALCAQDGATRHNLEIGGGGIFPLNGYIADDYSAGPAGRAGYELRLVKPLGAEAGITEAGLPGTSCDRFGCTHPRETLKFLDYGLRGHIGLSGGRIDLSAGLGGGYVWYEHETFFRNGPLFQYSGKAAVALDRGKRFRIAFAVRTWRDLGRPTQQWLSTTGSFIFGFGPHL
ncbi:MAG TPA: hypothetical protein VGZ73_29510 [Bryobacteraceae bacterium]|jgi:hypothetical protein|nr:hypothetical protein [Bryobacteraceae bacterium]